MVMLVELSLLCVQLVPVKIMSITHATVSPQVEGILASLCLIHLFLHTEILWQQRVWLQPLPVSGITQGRGERLDSDMGILEKRDLQALSLIEPSLFHPAP